MDQTLDIKEEPVWLQEPAETQPFEIYLATHSDGDDDALDIDIDKERISLIVSKLEERNPLASDDDDDISWEVKDGTNSEIHDMIASHLNNGQMYSISTFAETLLTNPSNDVGDWTEEEIDVVGGEDSAPQFIANTTKYLMEHSVTWKCHLCEIPFNSEASLKNHMKNNRGECQPTSLIKPKLKYGRVSKNSKMQSTQPTSLPLAEINCDGVPKGRKVYPVYRYVCKFCGKPYDHNYTYKMHIRTHTGEFPCTCRLCGKMFNYPSSYRRHLYLHKGLRPYACSICGRAFALPGNLREHAVVHTGEKPYACSICGLRYSQSGTRNKHQRRHNAHKPGHNYCGNTSNYNGRIRRNAVTYATKSSHGTTINNNRGLTKNADTHTGGITKDAEAHGRKTSHSITYSNNGGMSGNSYTHGRIVSLRDSKSTSAGQNSCENECNQTGQLENHKNTYTRNLSHTCTICGKSYRYPKHLQNHMLLHEEIPTHSCNVCREGDGPYSCHLCDKSFRCLSTAKRHILLHQGEKP